MSKFTETATAAGHSTMFVCGVIGGLANGWPGAFVGVFAGILLSLVGLAAWIVYGWFRPTRESDAAADSLEESASVRN